MAHLVSPTAFRSGKTFPWSFNSLLASLNNQQTLDGSVNDSSGLDRSANYLLLRSNYFIVKSNSKKSPKSNQTSLKILYYPLALQSSRRRHFPTYLLHRRLLKVADVKTSDGVFHKIWSLRQLEFQNRFISTAKRVKQDTLLSSKLSRGSAVSLKRKHYIKSLSKLSSMSGSNSLKKRTGRKICIKYLNVFKYLSLKREVVESNYKSHLINTDYSYNKKAFQSYYDVVNAFYILSHVNGSEHLIISIIQRSLLKMHRKKVKPKRFFYLLDKIVKTMPDVKDRFHACKLIITGKLRGGTARTKSFGVGFGAIPRQSLSENVTIKFGDVRSKYGSFGVKILTWRKA